MFWLSLLLSGVRLEEFFYEKVQGKRPVLQVDEGLLGQYMVQAGQQFDAATPYGMNHWPVDFSTALFFGVLFLRVFFISTKVNVMNIGRD